MNLQSPVARSIFLSIVFFITFTISRFISDDKITFKTFIPGLTGALAGGLVAFVFLKYVFKKK